MKIEESDFVYLNEDIALRKSLCTPATNQIIK